MFFKTLLSLTMFFNSLIGFTQYNSINTITGIVSDDYSNPVKGAIVFVDFIQLRKKSNKKGVFKVKVNDTQTISVYSPALGVLSKKANGLSDLEFNFPKDSRPLSEEELKALGFKFYKDLQNNNDWYADFSTILEILDKRFYNVRVVNGEIIIGKGANSFNGDKTPLVLVDDRPVDIGVLSTIATTDVKLIRVISNGSEASQYGGLKSSNGVILITLKE